MKFILYVNTLLTIFTMFLGLWAFGHGEITEYQFLFVTLFCVFIGVLSLYEAETTAD